MKVGDIAEAAWADHGPWLRTTALWPDAELLRVSRETTLSLAPGPVHHLLVLQGTGQLIVAETIVDATGGITLEVADRDRVVMIPSAPGTLLLLHVQVPAPSGSHPPSSPEPDSEAPLPPDSYPDASGPSPNETNALAPATRPESGVPGANARLSPESGEPPLTPKRPVPRWKFPGPRTGTS